MGTTMAVAFSVICIADLGKRLITVSPLKPFVWKRFIDDIFSLWNVPMEKVSIFVNFAHSFHSTIKFTREMSSERAASLDTEVFKGPRLSTLKILDSQTHFKPTETFQYTHFSSCHPFNTKKGLIKGEALRLLRTNSVKETFNKCKRDFEDSVTETIPQRSFIKSWLKFSSPTEQKLFVTKLRRRKKFYRLLPLTTRPHRILKRFLWNTSISFNSSLNLQISLTSHQLYLTGMKNHSRTF